MTNNKGHLYLQKYNLINLLGGLKLLNQKVLYNILTQNKYKKNIKAQPNKKNLNNKYKHL